jgi:hypothetical protein
VLDTFYNTDADDFQTNVQLAPGATYTFKVEARNSVGYSAYSDPISILAAQPPDQIEPPVTQKLV